MSAIMVRERARAPEQGYVLVTSLVLLLVVTIMAISMYRSFGVQEQIAGNIREKGRALQAAEAAEQYAEQWMQNGNGALPVVACNSLLAATPSNNVGQICTTPLTESTVINVPWTTGAGVPVGTSYTPSTFTVGSGQNLYYALPVFYITSLGTSADGSGTVYQVDAVGYGGTANAVAVVESTYIVGLTTTCLSCAQ
jgi:type IV pilus assembly protein PilX